MTGPVELLDAGLPGGVMGGFTTRTGGTSAPPYASLNLAQHVGDGPERVVAHRTHLAEAVGLPLSALVLPEQVHGSGVAVVGALGEDADLAGAAHHAVVPGVDALVTTAVGVGLVVLAADCLPVLLADAGGGVVAAAHAGRAGLIAGVLQETLAVMVTVGADPARIVAAIGPAACGGCYELPEALADEVGRVVAGSRSTTRWGTPSVDLLAGARTALAAAGVRQVSTVGGCTLEQPERFYSYRRDGVTGRHGGVVRLAPAP